MMLDAVTEHLDLWSSAHTTKSTSGRGSSSKLDLHGIKKLRELILDLAVRGKLVPQNPEDEPASVLLERIAAEKAQLVKEKKIKKQKPLPPIGDDEKPFKLPAGWEWVRLGDISADIHYGYTASANEHLTDVRLLRITDIQDDKVNWASVPGCEIASDKLEQYRLRNDDILIARTGGTIGKSYLVKDINVCSVFASYLIRVRQLEAMYADFIKTYLGSQLYWQQLYANSMGTGQPNVNGNALKNLIFALPPSEEAYRIVARVNELMTLCDQLEQQQTDSIAAHQTLVETLLATLTDSANAQEVAENWRRIADHFDTLFTTDHSIDQLKQTILQLAVMGRLVPQNPDDEPASVLLDKIAAEKARLVKEKVIKKQKALPPIAEDEKPFALPDGWVWVRLGDAYNFLNGYAFKSAWFKPEGVRLLRNINILHGETRWDEQACIEPDMAKEFERFELAAGDIVISLDRPLITTGLKYAVVEEKDLPCLLLQRVAKFHSYADAIMPEFLTVWLESNFFISKIDPGRSNGVPHISTSQLEKICFPVVPEAEQTRIRSKVDQLMMLCDSFKTHIHQTQTTQLNLANAIVEQAVG